MPARPETLRQPFDALDEAEDAPDGAVLYLDGGRCWYARSGARWYPLTFGGAMALLQKERARLREPSRSSREQERLD